MHYIFSLDLTSSRYTRHVYVHIENEREVKFVNDLLKLNGSVVDLEYDSMNTGSTCRLVCMIDSKSSMIVAPTITMSVESLIYGMISNDKSKEYFMNEYHNLSNKTLLRLRSFKSRLVGVSSHTI